MCKAAPLSLCFAYNAIRQAKKEQNLHKALCNEFRFTSFALAPEAEFIEGVRALIIDKDKSPKWQYADVDSVPQALLDRLYQPAPCGDIVFSGDTNLT